MTVPSRLERIDWNMSRFHQTAFHLAINADFFNQIFGFIHCLRYVPEVSKYSAGVRQGSTAPTIMLNFSQKMQNTIPSPTMILRTRGFQMGVLQIQKKICPKGTIDDLWKSEKEKEFDLRCCRYEMRFDRETAQSNGHRYLRRMCYIWPWYGYLPNWHFCQQWCNKFQLQ